MNKETVKYHKPAFLVYYTKWLIYVIFAKIVLKAKVVRNDLKNVKGPYIIMSNHTSDFDQLCISLLTKQRLTFVIADSIYYTAKFPWLMKQMRMVYKKQYKTTYNDIRNMKSVVENGGRLILFPTGVYTPSGKETTLPLATGKFLKLMGVDVYVVNLHGTHLSKPKWSKILKRGRVEIEAFQMITGDELKGKSAEELYTMAEQALSFNDYEWQENKRIPYKNGDDLTGLQNVLHSCPICKAHKSIAIKGKNTIYCKSCGFEETADEYCFLHNTKHPEQEIRHISDWADIIFHDFTNMIRENKNYQLKFFGRVEILNQSKHCFLPIGRAQIVLDNTYINIIGEDGTVLLHELVKTYPSIPCFPGDYFELHNSKDIYNFYPDDGMDVSVFVDTVNVLFKM